MVLQRIVGELLFFLREQNTVDLRVSPFTNQRYLLAHLGKVASQSGNSPLNGSVSSDAGSLLSKMPYFAAPVLQVDITQNAPGFTMISTAPQCRPPDSLVGLLDSTKKVASRPLRSQSMYDLYR